VDPNECASRELARFDWLEHGFGDRHSPLTQDGFASLTQIHSAEVVRVAGTGCAGPGDALITNLPGLAISIRTADCFPVLLVDQERRAVAAVHAGWRGTEAEIVRRTLAAMHSNFDTSPEHVFAAIGPGIGACCYQVSEDVGLKFGLAGAGRVDLAAANRAQLIASGVPPCHIDTLGFCTMCGGERFHSYRRDKESAGRMISYIGIKNTEGAEPVCPPAPAP
jgi:YfiH family protein